MADVEQVETSRGKFLAAAGLTGAALASGAAWQARRADAAVSPRSYTTGHYALELDGVTAFVESLEGGNAVGEVVAEPSSAAYYQRKHIGNVKFEECRVELDLAGPQPLYDWISSSMQGSYERKSGAIVAADFNYVEKSRRAFQNALVTSVSFPALDAASKESVSLGLGFTPESVQTKPGSGQSLKGSFGGKQKLWLPSNFRLTLGKLPTARVSKIDAFTVKQSVAEQVGDERIPTREPGKLEFPNLSITLPAVDVEPWQQWFEDFVIQGNNEQDKELSGSLTYLAPNLTDELGRVDFFNVGIFRLAEDSSSGDALARFRADLYLERLEFRRGKAGAAG